MVLIHPSKVSLRLPCEILIIIFFTPFRVFPTSVSWWFLTGVWVTASLLESPGLFSVFLIMLSIRPLISKPSNPCTNPLATEPRPPITIDITVTFTFHSFFFSCLARSRYLSGISRRSKIHNSASFFFFFFFFFLLIISRSGHLAEFRWSVYIWKSQRSLCVSFSRTDSGIYIYHLFVWLNIISCTIPSGSPCSPSRV